MRVYQDLLKSFVFMKSIAKMNARQTVLLRSSWHTKYAVIFLPEAIIEHHEFLRVGLIYSHGIILPDVRPSILFFTDFANQTISVCAANRVIMRVARSRLAFSSSADPA